MPQQPRDSLTWEELSPEERGAIIRAYGGPEYEQVLATGNGGAGVTDEELGNTPMLWPPATDADNHVVDIGEEGSYYMKTLRAEGHQTMIAIDSGTWEPGPNGMTLAYGEDYGSDNPHGSGNGSQSSGTGGPRDGGYNFHTYDPGRGLDEFDFKNMTGVNPGVTLDMSKYEPTPEMLAHIEKMRALGDEYRNKDPNRWAVDPNDLMQVGAHTYDPATADIYTTDFETAFDQTKDSIDYANAMNEYAANIDGTHLASAADLQYLAATGQMPLVADLRLKSDLSDLASQQMSMASRARGSSGAGLALMNAQNNSELGHLKLAQAANTARVAEMGDARNAYAQTGVAIRAGDQAAAGQAAANANMMYGVNNSELGAAQTNTQALNDGSQFNTGQENDAAKFNAGQHTTADLHNSNQLSNILDKNRIVGQQTETQDAAFGQSYDYKAAEEYRDNLNTGIQGEQDYMGAVADITTILGNIYGGYANNRTDKQIAEIGADATQTAAIIGGISSGVGAVATMSDRRVKHVGPKREPADFRDVEDFDWEYRDDAGPGSEWLGDDSMTSGMAQDFPDRVVEYDEDGNMRVNAIKAMLSYGGAIGDLQRKLDQLEKRR